jgi:hypothetical protein
MALDFFEQLGAKRTDRFSHEHRAVSLEYDKPRCISRYLATRCVIIQAILYSHRSLEFDNRGNSLLPDKRPFDVLGSG